MRKEERLVFVQLMCGVKMLRDKLGAHIFSQLISRMRKIIPI